MLLHLCVALLGGQTVGISANCVTENPAYPYFNGTSCVSCDAGTKGALPFFYQDKNECVSECPTEAPNPDADNVCRPCPANKPMWTGFECIDCLDAYPLGDFPFFDPKLGECTSKCPFGAPANSNNVCLPCANANGDTQSLWDPESQTCITECNGLSYGAYCLPCDKNENFEAPYWNEKEKKCTTCPDGLLWDPNTRQCTGKCSTRNYEGQNACEPCRYIEGMSKPAWGEGSCTACPEDKPNWNTFLYRCEPPCPPLQVWIGLTCYSVITNCNYDGGFVLNG